MRTVSDRAQESTTPPATGRVKTRADRLRESTSGYPDEVKTERRWVAFIGADPGTLPESNLQLAAGATLSNPETWLDLEGAIAVAHANRQTNGVAFVCGNGWWQARVTNPTDADWDHGVVAIPCGDSTGDLRVLMQHPVEDDEVNPRWPDERRWTTIQHLLWPVPTLTLTGAPPTAAELVDLAQANPDWLAVMGAYEGLADAGKGDPNPVAALLFDIALENTERGMADAAYFVDTVQSAMVRVKVDPPTKKDLKRVYTDRKAAKIAAAPRGKERSHAEKRRERAERIDGFADDIQQAHALADALVADGHRFQTDRGAEGHWLERDPATGLLSMTETKGKRGMHERSMAWVAAHADLIGLGNLSAIARTKLLLDSTCDLKRVQIQANALDQNPEIIGTPDGVLDIRTGRIRKATNDEWVTRQTSHAPAANYHGSVFYEWLKQAMPDEAERELLQNLAGYSLQGVRNGKLFVMLHGVPGAAKSALLSAMAHLLGQDRKNGGYCTFGTKRGVYANDNGECSIEYAIAAMEGYRVAIYDELQPQRTIDEDLIKSVTGAANQSARARFGHERNANITAVLWLASNSLPRVRFGGDPMVVRARMFKWLTVLNRPNIHAELLADRPALFAWMLEGAQRYMKHGASCLAPTASMSDDAVEWLGEGAVNPHVRFLADRFEVVPGGFVFTCDLAAEWDLWRGSMTGGQRVDSPFNAGGFADALLNGGYLTNGKGAKYAEPVRDTKRMHPSGTQKRGWANLMVRRDYAPTARTITPLGGDSTVDGLPV